MRCIFVLLLFCSTQAFGMWPFANQFKEENVTTVRLEIKTDFGFVAFISSLWSASWAWIFSISMWVSLINCVIFILALCLNVIIFEVLKWISEKDISTMAKVFCLKASSVILTKIDVPLKARVDTLIENHPVPCLLCVIVVESCLFVACIWLMVGVACWLPGYMISRALRACRK